MFWENKSFFCFQDFEVFRPIEKSLHLVFSSLEKFQDFAFNIFLSFRFEKKKFLKMSVFVQKVFPLIFFLLLHFFLTISFRSSS